MRVLLVFFSLMALVGCGEEVDEAGAQALWEKIQGQGYEQWQRAPGYEEPQPTVRAHGQTALVFMNESMAEAVAGPPLTGWPEGALLVKDSFEGDAKKLVAALEKQASGWYFAEWTPSGDVKYAGEPEVCTNCHSAGNDSVLAVALP